MKRSLFLTVCLLVVFSQVCLAETVETGEYTFNQRQFIQARHIKEGSIDTVEYVAKGESLTNWTQLLTHQEISVDAAGGGQVFRADEYAGLLWKQLLQERVAQPTRWNLLYSSKTSAVFSITFDSTSNYPAQFVVGLILLGSSNVINVVQWAIKTNSSHTANIEEQKSSWANLLITQAKLLPLPALSKCVATHGDVFAGR